MSLRRLVTWGRSFCLIYRFQYPKGRSKSVYYAKNTQDINKTYEVLHATEINGTIYETYSDKEISKAIQKETGLAFNPFIGVDIGSLDKLDINVDALKGLEQTIGGLSQSMQSLYGLSQPTSDIIKVTAINSEQWMQGSNQATLKETQWDALYKGVSQINPSLKAVPGQLNEVWDENQDSLQEGEYPVGKETALNLRGRSAQFIRSRCSITRGIFIQRPLVY